MSPETTHPEVELITSTSTENLIVMAARVSYASDDPGQSGVTERDKKLLRYLLKHKHWSPFAHNFLTFRVVSPIFIARQWMRHKSWEFNERSGRYTEFESQFFQPTTWRKQAKKNKQSSEGELEFFQGKTADRVYEDITDAAFAAYQQLLDLGVAREQARMVLPQSLMTEFYATASIRSVLHFLDLRDAPDAQLEMQHYAQEVRRIVGELYPHTLAAYEEIKNAR